MTRNNYLLALLVGVASVGAASVSIGAKDPLPVNSVWVGQLDQTELDQKQNETLDVVLWIQSEADDERTGVLLFPSVELNGKPASSAALFKVSIQLQKKGDITWVTQDILYAGGGKWEKGGFADGTIKGDKLTTRSKVRDHIVKMELARAEH